MTRGLESGEKIRRCLQQFKTLRTACKETLGRDKPNAWDIRFVQHHFGPNAVDPLFKEWIADSDPFLQKAAVDALGNLRLARTTAQLLEIVESTRFADSVRSQADISSSPSRLHLRRMSWRVGWRKIRSLTVALGHLARFMRSALHGPIVTNLSREICRREEKSAIRCYTPWHVGAMPAQKRPGRVWTRMRITSVVQRTRLRTLRRSASTRLIAWPRRGSCIAHGARVRSCGPGSRRRSRVHRRFASCPYRDSRNRAAASRLEARVSVRVLCGGRRQLASWEPVV